MGLWGIQPRARVLVKSLLCCSTDKFLVVMALTGVHICGSFKGGKLK